LFKPEMAEADDDEADDDINMYRREQVSKFIILFSYIIFYVSNRMCVQF